MRSTEPINDEARSPRTDSRVRLVLRSTLGPAPTIRQRSICKSERAPRCNSLCGRMVRHGRSVVSLERCCLGNHRCNRWWPCGVARISRPGVGLMLVTLSRPSGIATVPDNKALHQTRRQGVPASRAVVEGRLAGEGRCCAGVAVGPLRQGRRIGITDQCK